MAHNARPKSARVLSSSRRSLHATKHLEKHADDGHHGESAVRELSRPWTPKGLGNLIKTNSHIRLYGAQNYTFYPPFRLHAPVEQPWKINRQLIDLKSWSKHNPSGSFFVFSAGSLEVKTLKPKSPAAAGVPGDWSWETSQKAM